MALLSAESTTFITATTLGILWIITVLGFYAWYGNRTTRQISKTEIWAVMIAPIAVWYAIYRLFLI